MNAPIRGAWRSLSGHPLEGEKLVRLVYVDEAGIGNEEQEPFLVVAGIIVHADDQLIAIERHIQRLIERHIPPRLRDGFVFHAKELFNGGRVLTRQKPDVVGPQEWPLNRRLAMADDLVTALRKFALPISIGFVRRADLKSDFALPDNFPKAANVLFGHSAAFLSCSMSVERWMREKLPREVCMMIVEDNEHARETLLRAMKAHQNPRLLDQVGEEERMFFPFRKIKEAPLFQPKSGSSVLQLADFAAYVFKRVLMKDMRYRRFANPLWDQLLTFPHLVKERLA